MSSSSASSYATTTTGPVGSDMVHRIPDKPAKYPYWVSTGFGTVER